MHCKCLLMCSCFLRVFIYQVLWGFLHKSKMWLEKEQADKLYITYVFKMIIIMKRTEKPNFEMVSCHGLEEKVTDVII
jgi:hypothetical protein